MHMLQSLFYHPSSGVQNNCNCSIW